MSDDAGEHASPGDGGPGAGGWMPRRPFAIAIGAGVLTAAAYLVAGPLALLPALVIWAYLLTRPAARGAVGRVVAAGLLVGFGVGWLAIVGRAAWACAQDTSCSFPDGPAWLALGAFVLAVGLAVLGVTGLRARRT